MLPAAFIFDVDGTLAETEEAHRQAFNETFTEYGLGWNWSRDEYRLLLRTTGGKERMARFASDQGLEIDAGTISVIHKVKTTRYAEIVASGALQLRSGIEELFEMARQNGIRLAVATTTNLPNVETLFRAVMGADAEEVFEVIAAGDQVANKKPAPDVYQLALDRLGLPAPQCLAFEDSRNGVLSARAAGIPVVVSPSRYTQGEDFAGAVALVEEYSELTLDGIRDFMASGAA